MICCVKLFINRIDGFVVIREMGIFAVLDDVHTDRCNYVELCNYLSFNCLYAVEYPNDCCNCDFDSPRRSGSYSINYVYLSGNGIVPTLITRLPWVRPRQNKMVKLLFYPFITISYVSYLCQLGGLRPGGTADRQSATATILDQHHRRLPHWSLEILA